jgi:hypothetical protein
MCTSWWVFVVQDRHSPGSVRPFVACELTTAASMKASTARCGSTVSSSRSSEVATLMAFESWTS